MEEIDRKKGQRKLQIPLSFLYLELFLVIFLYSPEKCVNVFPAAGGWDITAGGNDKIGMAGAALGHDTQGFLPELFHNANGGGWPHAFDGAGREVTQNR